MCMEFKTSPDFTYNMMMIQLLSKPLCTSILSTMCSFDPPSSSLSSLRKEQDERRVEGRFHRITESQNSRGWKGPLWVI